MGMTRRDVLAGVAVAPLVGAFGAAARSATTSSNPAADSFDPWLEIDTASFRRNIDTISGLSGERPIMAVIKNNAYGLGLTTVAAILEPFPEVHGFAVVKTSEALALRAAGIMKPVLLMGLFSDSDGAELVRQKIQLSVCTDGAAAMIEAAGKAAGTRPEAQLYLDTGMGRMGVPYHRALPVIEDLASRDIDVVGTFTGFTESDFDTEQLDRFNNFIGDRQRKRIRPGSAACSVVSCGLQSARRTSRSSPTRHCNVRGISVGRGSGAGNREPGAGISVVCACRACRTAAAG